jgi:uncharacterized repeat protein (TIGR01451 family)
MDGATVLGTAKLVAGSAAFKTAALTEGSHSITAVYGGDGNYQESMSAILTQIINPLTDLAVVMGGATSAKSGKNITYTIKVTNKGPSTATGVTLTDILPAGVTLVSASSTQGTVQVVGNTVTVTIGTLLSGAPATTITIVVTTTTPGSITNTASVTGTETDPKSTNNSDMVTTVVT